MTVYAHQNNKEGTAMRVSLSDYREELRDAYARGMTFQRIADLFGVTDAAVRDAIGPEWARAVRRMTGRPARGKKRAA